MKRLFYLAAICCFAVYFVSCQKNHDGTTETENPVAGTSWVWSEDPITWTFTFGEKEVIFDYLGEFSPEDISTDQYRSTYTYTSNTVSFTMSGWSGVVWKYTGTISVNTMHLVDSGIEKIDIYLTKKE